MSSANDPTQFIDPNLSRVPGFSVGQKVFGRYTLEAIAGRGGMGIVWRARDDELERTVALKFLPEAVASDVEAVRDLKAETKRCLDLTHPHIVRVYDFVQGPAGAAIAMEFVQGESLAGRKVSNPNGCLSIEEVGHYTGPLCAALDYAHFKAHLLHRDLKPANLLVTTAGDLKVMDFGIACSLAETRTRMTADANRSTSGTLLYMSPQQLLGAKPSLADDIYALGSTLYELISGKPPFFRGDGYALMMQIREQPPKPMSVQRADLQISADPIPDDWERVVLACLAKEPKDRPQSAGEVAEMLGIATEKPLRLLVTNNPLNIGSGSGAQGGTPTSRTARTQAEAPATAGSTPTASLPPSPAKRLPWIALAASAAVIVGGGLYFLTRHGSPKSPTPATQSTNARAVAPSTNDAAAQQAGASVSPAEAKPVAPAAAPVTTRGGAIVRTTPAGAEVTIGALDHGPSPLTVRDVLVGNYPVKIRLNGYEEWSGEVEVKGNEFAEMDVKLERSTGTLLVSSEPFGLDGTISGRVTPGGPVPGPDQAFKTPQKLVLPTGTYDITIHSVGWPDQKNTVEVTRNQVVESTGVFAAGQIVVTSDPAGADVVMGGKTVGVTPLTLTNIQPGPQSVTLKLKGFQTTKREGVVEARGELRLNAVLEKPPEFKAGDSKLVPGLNLELKFIPAGSFVLGSPDSEPHRDSSEGPQTEVTFTQGFWIGKTEVTQQQYQLLMGVNPSRFKAVGPEAPVDSLSWYAANEFCRRLNERERAAGNLPEGYTYSLPTEAQWEYACRAGTTGANFGEPGRFAWIEKEGGKTTHPVAARAPNAWGLYDMNGNVWEWCLDFYGERLPGGNVTDYAGPPTGTLHVLRGGAWNSPAKDARSATRERGEPGDTQENIGFRLALTTPQTGIVGVGETKSGNFVLGGISAGAKSVGAGAKSLFGNIVHAVRPGEKRTEAVQNGTLVVTIAKAPPAPLKFVLTLTRADGGSGTIDFAVDESITAGRNDRGAVVTRLTVPAGSYSFVLKSAGFRDVTQTTASSGDSRRRDPVTVRGGGETSLEFELEPVKAE
ncbi:MAG TPA: SUMF1/EgtB/PvdO family nonheme iron enzyme [Lacunisphaera sp.]|nr:SUMF1/EgtB/PvdO family nonheme iron enzyme [Lacunisphaera sp.]